MPVCKKTFVLLSDGLPRPWPSGRPRQTAVKPAGPPAVANAAAAVVRRNLHLPIFNVHDPWILAYAPTRTYYLYTSNNARATGINRPGTIAYRSKDLLNWEGPLCRLHPSRRHWAGNQRAWHPRFTNTKAGFTCSQLCITQRRSSPRCRRFGGRLTCAEPRLPRVHRRKVLSCFWKTTWGSPA